MEENKSDYVEVDLRKLCFVFLFILILGVLLIGNEYRQREAVLDRMADALDRRADALDRRYDVLKMKEDKLERKADECWESLIFREKDLPSYWENIRDKEISI